MRNRKTTAGRKAKQAAAKYGDNLRRTEASNYLREVHELKYAPATLAKYAAGASARPSNISMVGFRSTRPQGWTRGWNLYAKGRCRPNGRTPKNATATRASLAKPMPSAVLVNVG